MTDGPKKPRWPPRQLSDDEVVEIPPAPPLPREPFRRVAVTNAEIVAKLEEVIAGHRLVVGTQRKMALQLDGFGHTVNARFDVLHEELAMLRQLVTADHELRIEKVERSLGQKVAKGGGIVGVILVALPLLSDVLPKYRALFDSILGALQ